MTNPLQVQQIVRQLYESAQEARNLARPFTIAASAMEQMIRAANEAITIVEESAQDLEFNKRLKEKNRVLQELNDALRASNKELEDGSERQRLLLRRLEGDVTDARINKAVDNSLLSPAGQVIDGSKMWQPQGGRTSR